MNRTVVILLMLSWIGSNQTLVLPTGANDSPITVLQAGVAPPSLLVIGGTYNSTPITLSNGQSSQIALDNAGNVQVNLINPSLTISGTVTANQGGTWNIATVSTVSAATISGGVVNATVSGTVGATQSGTWNFGGLGTAGSPVGGILTVQGTTSGTPIPVSLASGTLSGGTLGTVSNVGAIINPLPAGTNILGSVTISGTATLSGGTLSSVAALTAGTVSNAPQAGSGFAWTPCSVGTTSAVECKASSGNVAGLAGVYNPNTAVCFLQFYATTSATPGTNALYAAGIPPGSGGWPTAPTIAAFNLANGISVAESTTATGGSACPSVMPLTVLYQ